MKVYRIIVISMLALLLSHPSFAMTNEEEGRFKIITICLLRNWARLHPKY